jgi:hypothetical protein
VGLGGGPEVLDVGIFFWVRRLGWSAGFGVANAKGGLFILSLSLFVRSEVWIIGFLEGWAGVLGSWVSIRGSIMLRVAEYAS